MCVLCCDCLCHESAVGGLSVDVLLCWFKYTADGWIGSCHLCVFVWKIQRTLREHMSEGLRCKRAEETNLFGICIQ